MRGRGTSGSGVRYGLYSARPAPGTVGRIYVPSDSPFGFVDDGAAWRPLIESPGVAVEPPLAAAMTNVRGVVGSALTDMAGSVGSASGGWYLTAPNGGSSDVNNSVWNRSKVGNKTLTACFSLQWGEVAAAGTAVDVGLAFRCGVGGDAGKVANFKASFDAGVLTSLSAQNFINNGGNWSANVASHVVMVRQNCFWLRFADDGVNLVTSWSPNGLVWRQLNATSRAIFFAAGTIDFMGLWSSPYSGNVFAQVLSYSET